MQVLQAVTALLLVFSFLVPRQVDAHGIGLSPFLKINRTITNTHPLQIVSYRDSGFIKPEDIAPQPYLVGEKINFNIDLTQLRLTYPDEILNNMTYVWDFGDGTYGKGMTDTHRYTKPGSYLLKITTKFRQPDVPEQVIDKVLIHILPYSTYHLPHAVIKVNQQHVEDPLKEGLELDLTKELSFDASGSRAGSGKIIEYIWDFGGSTSTNPRVTYRYANDQTYVSPALRIKDSNGFLSYAFVDITQASPEKIQKMQQQQSATKTFLPMLSLAGITLIVGVIVFLLSRKKTKKKKRRKLLA